MDLTSASYQLSRDGQQYGPYLGEQIMQMAQTKQVLPTDHLWCEGMAEWTPAQSFSQLAPIFAAAAPQAAVTPTATAGAAGVVARGNVARPGVAARKSPAARKTTGVRPGARGAAVGAAATGKKGANFSILMWALVVFLIGVGMAIGGSVSMGTAMSSALEQADPNNFDNFAPSAPSGMSIFLMVGGMVLYAAGLLTYSIMTLVYLHRGWTLLQVLPRVRSTPGKAIGFLFIPFFNYYWIFVCYHGWAQDYGLLKQRTQIPGAPEVPSGLFMAFCIGCFLGFGPLLHPFLMAKLCNGINFLASKSDEELGAEAYA